MLAVTKLISILHKEASKEILSYGTLDPSVINSLGLISGNSASAENKLKTESEAGSCTKLDKNYSKLQHKLGVLSNNYISNFVIDSKKVNKGSVFIALRGKNYNGADFILDAIQNGALMTITDNVPDKLTRHIKFWKNPVLNKMGEWANTIDTNQETDNTEERVTNSDRGVEIGSKLPKTNGKVTLILVKDTYSFLKQIAKLLRTKLTNSTLIGITGSNGKTTTKDMLAFVLDEMSNSCDQGSSWNYPKSLSVFSSFKNYNNEIGVALNMWNFFCFSLNTASENKIGVFELGMNQKGEIRELADIVRPNIGMITNIGSAHIGLLGTKDEIARAKAEIFEGITSSNHVLLNISSEKYELLSNLAEKHSLNVISVGDSSEANLRLLQSRIIDFKGKPKTEVSVKLTLHSFLSSKDLVPESTGNPENFKLEAKYFLPVVGKQFVYASMFVLGAITRFITLQIQKEDKVKLTEMKNRLEKLLAPCLKAMENFNPTEGRSHLIKTKNGVMILDDSYNASFESIQFALEQASLYRDFYWDHSSDVKNPSIVLIIGDMGELGEKSEELHRNLVDEIEKNGISLVFAVGHATSSFIFPNLPLAKQGTAFKRVEEAAPILKEQFRNGVIKSGDIVLVKGSRFMHLDKLVQSMVLNF